MKVPTRSIYKLHCKGSVQRSLTYPQFEVEICGHVLHMPVSQSVGNEPIIVGFGCREYYFVQYVRSKPYSNSNGGIEVECV
jgi:hypothetical protein